MTAIDITHIEATPEPPRDRYGRYIFPTPTGKLLPHTRATTIAKAVADTTALEKWKMRQVAYGIGLRNDLYALAAGHNPETDRQTYEKLCEQAMEAAGSSVKASLGTALHRLTEHLDTGTRTINDMPEEWRERLTAYQQAITVNQLTVHPQWIEQRLIDDRYTVAGTCDRIVTLPDGRRVISDLKTGANLNYSWTEIAIQLAIYANHTTTVRFNPRTTAWDRSDRVDVDRDIGLVIHLPATGAVACDIYTIDLTQGYAGYILAHEVREYRKSKGIAQVYRPAPPPQSERDWLQGRIKALTPPAVTELRALWPADIPAPLPKPPTPQQVDVMARILDGIETRHQIPFGAPRPAAAHPTTNHE